MNKNMFKLVLLDIKRDVMNLMSGLGALVWALWFSSSIASAVIVLYYNLTVPLETWAVRIAPWCHYYLLFNFIYLIVKYVRNKIKNIKGYTR